MTLSAPAFFGFAPRAARHRRVAFTLLELMVAMAVGLLMIVFLFQLFNATAGAWRRGEDQSDTFREARAAMQLMVRDISQTTAPFANNVYSSPWPSPSPSPSPALPVLVLDRYTTPNPPPRDTDPVINEELYCLTNVPNNGSSNLCAVGYFCSWMPDLVPTDDPQLAQKQASAPCAFALVRQFLGSGKPGPTSGAPPAVPGLFDRFKSASGKSTLSFIDVYERARPPTIPSASLNPPVATATQLASYIWDLQFRTPATLSVPAATASSPYLANPPSGYPTVLPAYVEIRFKALSARAARQLAGNTSILPSTWSDAKGKRTEADALLYQRIILPGTRQFVVRVPLGSASATRTP